MHIAHSQLVVNFQIDHLTGTRTYFDSIGACAYAKYYLQIF